MIFGISETRTPLSVEEVVGRILVVEDDQDIAELIAHHLGKAGYLSDVVHSGDKVPSLVQDNPPDLIILDLMLPGQNGLDICRAIRSDSRSSNIPIIIVTAKTEETDRIVGLELGADDYLPKPFEPRELLLRINNILNNNIFSYIKNTYFFLLRFLALLFLDPILRLPLCFFGYPIFCSF